jgi:hypothetical protein
VTGQRPAAGEHPSLTTFMRSQAAVARDLADADRTNWDGRYTPLNEPGIRGRAEWTGTIRYDERRVLAPLREMFRTPGRQHDRRTLERFASAMKTVLHENAHLLTSRRTSHMNGKHQVESQPATKALEEGISELWAQRNLKGYIDRLGLESIAPGIGEARPEQSYEQYTPAAAALVEMVAEKAGLHPDEVLRRMNNVHAGQKWEVAADLLYEANGLPELVPPERRSEVTRNIAREMRDGFERNHPDRFGPRALPDSYAEAGKAAFAAGQRDAEVYRATYGDGQIVQRARGSRPSGRSTRGPPNRSGLEDADRAAALHSSEAPPLSSTRRLHPSQFGSQRDPAQPANSPGRGPEVTR